MRASLQLLPLAPIGGLVAALGQDPYTLPLAHLAGLALLFALIRHSPDRTASALRGFLFSLGYFGLTLAWLIHPFQVNAEAHGWLAPIALALLVTGLAFLWSLTIWLSHNLTPDPTWRAFSTALLLTMTEMFREHLFTGFPWALPGYIWTDQPIGQAASLIGVHGLTALTLFVAALPFTGRRPIASLLLAAGLLAFLHTFGLMRLAAHPSDSANGIPVRIVQPNIPQEEKWPADFAARNRDRLFTPPLTPATETDPALIIWPETAITWERLEASQTNLPATTLPPNRQILTGIIRQDDHAVYNSALLHRPNTPITHIDKSRLVPFGEYIPLAGFLSRFGLGPLAVGDSSGFSRGDSSTLLTTAGIGPIRVLICYAAIFPGLVRQQHRPIALVQIT
ncbi:MAG: apolipoprotein N-acyltransferase, partial [Rhodobacteraceae bacterium]|nr:apolipoprotein N-acyltransferase [Paracoccaceae bacterium]